MHHNLRSDPDLSVTCHKLVWSSLVIRTGRVRTHTLVVLKRNVNGTYTRIKINGVWNWHKLSHMHIFGIGRAGESKQRSKENGFKTPSSRTLPSTQSLPLNRFSFFFCAKICIGMWPSACLEIWPPQRRLSPIYDQSTLQLLLFSIYTIVHVKIHGGWEIITVGSVSLDWSLPQLTPTAPFQALSVSPSCKFTPIVAFHFCIIKLCFWMKCLSHLRGENNN